LENVKIKNKSETSKSEIFLVTIIISVIFEKKWQKLLSMHSIKVTGQHCHLFQMRSKKTNIQQHGCYKKMLLHRQRAAWNDDQIITHFRNALKKEVIDWFDSLPAVNVSLIA
jgi:hypothetical protein